MSWIIAGLIGVAIGAFVLGAEVITYFVQREKFSRISFGCGFLGMVLSMSGVIDSLGVASNYI